MLKPYRPKLVHGWHLFASPYAGAAARLLGSAASLGSLRGNIRAYRRQRAHSALTELLTDGLVVNSESAARELARSPRLRSRPVHVVVNAVEEAGEERGRSRSRLGEKYRISQSLWIGSIGRLESSKRFDVLLHAVARLRDAGEDVALVVFGDGPMLPALRKEATRLGIQDRVIFAGEDADARSSVGAPDGFCFPSEEEGLPNAVLEAAAAGVPIVAWRTPFLEGILEAGRSASLVETGDVAGLETAISELLHDPVRRERLGRDGRTRVLERFSIAQFVRAMTSVYEAHVGNSAEAVEA